jgi:HlyD family secretion protein
VTRRRLLLALLLAGLVTAAGGIAAYAILSPIPVVIARPEADVPVQVFGLGTVEARIVSKVGFKVAGTLTELHADQGEIVPAGTTLARLDTREQEAKLGKAKATVAQAEANLLKADAAVVKAQAALTRAQSVDERRRTLLGRGNVSIEAAEAAQAERDAAEAELAVTSSEVQVARAAIEDARAEQDYESTVLALHTLTAPYDALVVARLKELGSVLAAGEAVFTLIDPTTVWVLAHVDESQAGELAIGQPAEVVLRSRCGDRLPGRVARIDIESDRVSEERRVYVAFDRCPEDFHLGEQTEVVITTGRLDHALVVPETAVEDAGGGAGTVWTVEDGRLARRDVVLGHRLLDGRVELAGGVPEGASVVIGPSSGSLRIGRAVRIVEEASRP